MKQKQETPDFSFSLEEFAGEMKTKIGFIHRDKDEFEKFGVTDEKIDDVETGIEEFSEIPTDEELLGLQVTATQDKDAKADTLRVLINEIMVRAANKFGETSGRYKMFGVHTLSALDGWALSTTARRVLRVSKTFLEELAGEGLTEEILQQLTTLKDDYDTSLEKQEDAIANRDITADDRVKKANAVYALVAKYCNTGMKIWQNTNEAKYNDYVLYGTTPKKPKTDEGN